MERFKIMEVNHTVKEVEGYPLENNLFAYKRDKQYHVVDIPTGRSIGSYPTLKEVRAHYKEHFTQLNALRSTPLYRDLYMKGGE